MAMKEFLAATGKNYLLKIRKIFEIHLRNFSAVMCSGSSGFDGSAISNVYSDLTRCFIFRNSL